MRLKLLVFSLTMTACNGMCGQAAARIAILPANGHFSAQEGRVTDSLTSDMVGTPGVAVIDRASIERILKEQNFQNSDRASADSAVRIGKLVGAGQIILVQVQDASYSTKQDKQPGATTTTGTVVLNASARLIDVETAVILAQSASNFEQSQVISTSTQSPVNPLAPRAPRPTTTTGSDPNVVQTNLSNRAYGAVAADLANKLMRGLGSASSADSGSSADLPLVAGIANGSVYINEGSRSGIQAGSRFQVVRTVSVGLKDPRTGKDIQQKKRVCTFVATNVDETSSSGTCSGGIPQSGDVAEPAR
jgi:hypothetical protein